MSTDGSAYRDDRLGDERGLTYSRVAASRVAPRYMESNVLFPIRSVGLDRNTTLKATFWDCTLAETVGLGDPDFAGIALMTRGRAWRNSEAKANHAGGLSMMPFEGARWRFDGPCGFVQLYVPFKLIGAVSESLFEREITQAALQMPSALRDDKLCRTANIVANRLAVTDPTNLMLDSWALMLADVMVRHFSSHTGKHVRTSFGKIPGRGIAHVVDYIEANIDRDLDLASLSGVAAMSVYHFARRFKETVGISPHAYVLSRRIRRARDMLNHGETSLAFVATACGFASQAHFTMAFQHDLGVTPGQYRRAISL